MDQDHPGRRNPAAIEMRRLKSGTIFGQDPAQTNKLMDQNLDTRAQTLTKTLCSHLAAARFDDLPAAARREARRGLLDWIGCALAGSRHRTISTLLDVLHETAGKPVATVLGRKLKLGLLDAPLANGQMGHV